nr:hypothetical protein [uncultured Halomonas sp.]
MRAPKSVNALEELGQCELSAIYAQIHRFASRAIEPCQSTTVPKTSKARICKSASLFIASIMNLRANYGA